MLRSIRRRSLQASVTVALATLFVLPAEAHGAGGQLKIRARVDYSDSVGVVVEVGALPHEECGARIGEGGREAEAPTVQTGTEGGAKWSWFVPGNVGEGNWTFEATCGRGEDLEHGHKTFGVGAGSGRRSKGLWIERSMYAEAIRLPASPAGNGGGGNRSTRSANAPGGSHANGRTCRISPSARGTR